MKPQSHIPSSYEEQTLERSLGFKRETYFENYLSEIIGSEKVAYIKKKKKLR